MASNKKPMKNGVAGVLAFEIRNLLEKNGVKVEICGSLRRGREIVNDIDMVVSEPTSRIAEILKKRKGVVATETKKGGKFSFLIDECQFDIHYAPPEQWGAAVLFLTGSGLFNIILRGIAKNQGYKLNERGLYMGEDCIAGRTEVQIFDALGYEYIAPQEREVTPENRKRRWLREKPIV